MMNKVVKILGATLLAANLISFGAVSADAKTKVKYHHISDYLTVKTTTYDNTTNKVPHPTLAGSQYKIGFTYHKTAYFKQYDHGSYRVEWHQGKWTIKMYGNRDKEDSGYFDGLEASNEIADYFHNHTLPKVNKYGIISIHVNENQDLTYAKWQNNKKVNTLHHYYTGMHFIEAIVKDGKKL